MASEDAQRHGYGHQQQHRAENASLKYSCPCFSPRKRTEAKPEEHQAASGDDGYQVGQKEEHRSAGNRPSPQC
jgi:hypothetical protein